MKITQRLQNAIREFRKADNTIGSDLSRSFLKYGNNKPLVQDWSRVIMSDRDLYTGYPYAAINNRANAVAHLAKYNLKTQASKETMTASQKSGKDVVHPYIDIINKSISFPNNKFWYDISTYLDLEGVYYIFVLRTVEGQRVGNPQQFKLLNPYDVRRIIDRETMEIGGYVETRDGLVREFAVPQIIEIRKLNPFSEEDPFSMTDAAKESQYTLKQAGDYTRHSLKNNMASPGIISTDVILEPELFKNFVSRVTNQEKGLPLFGNGAGSIEWDAMQIDMDKAALDKINEIHRQALFAVSGTGKTIMSIEESGTTRDTARAQKEIFIENHAMPQIELILDALNQDYKVYYPNEYSRSQYEMYIDNPLGIDREAELKDVQIRDKSYVLYDRLIAQGYSENLAAKYAQGEIKLEDLGKPTNEPRPNPAIEAAKLKATPIEEPQPKKKTTKKTESHEHISAIKNEYDEDEQGIIQTQQSSLENAVQIIEGRVINSSISKIFEQKNQFEEEQDVIDTTAKEENRQELELTLAAFYLVLMKIYGSSTMAARAKEFGMTGMFKLDDEVKKYVSEISKTSSLSHLDTILEDVRTVAKEQYNNEVQNRLSEIVRDGRAVTDEDLVLARKLALEGKSRVNIENAIKQKYIGEISTTRAKAIARTETNRAFTQSQYFADMQFIKQNGLEGRAYKKWTTRSTNPCAICLELASRGPIPFEENFADLGDELTATYTDENGKTKVQKQLVNFEELSSGNAHVNCSCRYILIIQ